MGKSTKREGNREERQQKQKCKRQPKVPHAAITCIECGATVKEAAFTYSDDFCDECAAG